MGAARRELSEFDLDRGRDPLHKSPAALWQRQKRLATFGERLATPSGQFGESTRDRLVHSSQVPDKAVQALLSVHARGRPQANKRENGVAVEITGDAPVCSCCGQHPPSRALNSPYPPNRAARKSSLRAKQLRGRKIG